MECTLISSIDGEVRMLDDELAQQIALGDFCPISHQPIADINSQYQPQSRTSAASSSKSKPPATLAGPMDRFLSAKAKAKKSPLRPKTIVSMRITAKPTIVVKGSGMRTLAGEQEKIQASKVKKSVVSRTAVVKTGLESSFFFGTRTAALDPSSINSPSKPQRSMQGNGHTSVDVTVVEVDQEESVEVDVEPVDQEEGYRSPSPSFAELRDSSPVFVPSPIKENKSTKIEDDGWEDEEVLSSPVKPSTQQRAPRLQWSVKNSSAITSTDFPSAITLAKVEREIISLVSPTPSPRRGGDEERTILVPDLSSFFESFESIGNSQEGSSGVPLSERSTDEGPSVGASDDVNDGVVGEFVTSPASPIGDGVPESDFDAVAESDFEGARDEEDRWEEEEGRRLKIVAKGWRARYSLGNSAVQPVGVLVLSTKSFDS